MNGNYVNVVFVFFGQVPMNKQYHIFKKKEKKKILRMFNRA